MDFRGIDGEDDSGYEKLRDTDSKGDGVLMKKVVKFGGSSLASAKQFKR